MARNECYRAEFRVVRPSGETRWLRSVACLIPNSTSGHRRAIGCVTVAADVNMPNGTNGLALAAACYEFSEI
ncbi:PAS domain-containing protein [Bradyrhizobium sp. USDA 4451]